MTVDYSKYKNIDKSTAVLLDEKQKFSVITIENQSNETEHYLHQLKNDYIQLYFCLNKESKVAFNMEHCAIHLQADDSSLVYFKDDSMNLLFEVSPNSQIIMVLVPVQHFHSIFSSQDNFPFNFDNFKIGKPIIETKQTPPSIKTVLHQLLAKKLNNSLRTLYTKGKVYELLSLYFNMSEENITEHCPFMANEETVAKIKHAKDIILEQMASPPSLEELAKMVGLNIKKLKMGFKEFYGAPVFTFLLNYKLEYAKKLLNENQLNVNEIALQVGYSNSSHFIAAFKKKFGVTPKQFTKQD